MVARGFAAVRCIIHPDLQWGPLRREKLWVEYDRSKSIRVMLVKLKKSLGIAAAVELHLDEFYVPPDLNASLLEDAQDPVVLLPSEQNQVVFGREGETSRKASGIETPSTEQTFSFRPEKMSTPKNVAAEHHLPQPQAMQGNLRHTIAEDNPVVTLPNTPKSIVEARPSEAGVEIMEMNFKPESDYVQEIRLSAGTPKGRRSGRKLKVESVSPSANGRLALLENNAAIVLMPLKPHVRISVDERQKADTAGTGRVASPTSIQKGNGGMKKRRASAGQENVKPKRSKSASGAEAGILKTDSFIESLVNKARRLKGKKSGSNLADEPALIPVEFQETLGSKEVEVTSAGDGSAGATDAMGFSTSPDVTMTETSETALATPFLTVSQLASAHQSGNTDLEVAVNAKDNDTSSPMTPEVLSRELILTSSEDESEAPGRSIHEEVDC